MDRLQEIMMAAENVTFSKNQSSALVGGRKTTDKKNGRWECKGSDVLRYAIPQNYTRV